MRKLLFECVIYMSGGPDMIPVSIYILCENSVLTISFHVRLLSVQSGAL